MGEGLLVHEPALERQARQQRPHVADEDRKVLPALGTLQQHLFLHFSSKDQLLAEVLDYLRPAQAQKYRQWAEQLEPDLTVEEIFGLALWAAAVPKPERAERIEEVLELLPRIRDFRIVASHQESLHSHDAVSVLTEGPTFASESLEPRLFASLHRSA